VILVPRALTTVRRTLTAVPRTLTAVLAVALALSALALPALARAATVTTPTTTYVPTGSSPPAGTSAGRSSALSNTSTSVPGQAALPVRPARSARSGHGHLTAGAIVIAALAGLLVLACAAWALARRRAYEPRWWLSLRHALAEAGFRASATWAEFTDWLRLGH
jgi:hypothetical protein